MGLLFDSLIVELLAFGLAAWALFYWYATKNYNYWQSKGVPTVKKLTPLLGTMAETFTLTTQLGIFYQKMYNELDGERFGGYYKLRDPALLIRDPELIKSVLVKDFHSFHDNDIHINESNDPMLAYNIFSIHGPRWKYLRTRLTPAFTSGKMKMMFPLMLEVCDELKKHIQRAAEKKEGLETKRLAASYTTDNVGTCAFGVKCNSLENENNTFRQMGLELVTVGPVRGLMLMIVLFCPKLGDLLGLKFISDKLANFFRKMVKDAMEYREKNNVTRQDFIHLLMQLKKKGQLEADPADKSEKQENGTKQENGAPDNYEESGKLDFTHDVLTAQAVGFFGDGFETSSTALGFAIFEIAYHQDVQDRVREEIEDVLEKHGGKLCYEAIQEMPYLDRVISETLRMYPPAGAINRLCTQRYQIPGSDLKIEVGTTVSVPVYALQHDPKYWPEPERFDPDRFTEENKKDRVPYTFLPFSEGPRICIGMRFAQTQIKAALVTIVKNFNLKPTGQTEYPVELDPNFFLIHPKNGLHVSFEKRN
ncbi:cytochrome P450 6k1-like [Neocloeon triangulifer]|uniref:cytochrome P450 6k1-like n=1 Tax=Neocloeon triangulifer TaxID=2078957 RepID=UPI00286F81D6|nr:cytochrome P450 6k1-like [Neocloeon triangulifer]XP_059488822.1 cytochrome P450 6k1-like [Neocloeon triangulifer]